MIHIAENSRIFTDKINLKVYQYIHPTISLADTSIFPPVISLNHKILARLSGPVPNRYAFAGCTILLYIIAGSISYRDTTGFKSTLQRGDLLRFDDQYGSYENCLLNSGDETEAELIEIIVPTAIKADKHYHHICSSSTRMNALKTISTALPEPNTNAEAVLAYEGRFEDNILVVHNRAHPDGKIVLINLRGTMIANETLLNRYDVLIIDDGAALTLNMLLKTTFLLFEFK